MTAQCSAVKVLNFSNSLSENDPKATLHIDSNVQELIHTLLFFYFQYQLEKSYKNH